MIKRLLQFRKREDGVIAVESVLWFPVFVLIAAVIVDVSSLVISQTRMQNAAADGARLVALGRLTESQAETLMAARSTSDTDYTTNIVIGTNIVQATVEMNYSDLVGLGVFSQITGTFGAEAFFRLEAGVGSS